MFIGAILLPRNAAAEISLVDVNGWNVFTDGRLNAFISRVQGDAYPRGADANMDGMADYSIIGGSGLTTTLDGDGSGKFAETRVRSGFLGNIFAIGIRKQLSPNLKLTGYFQFWSTIETNRTRYLAINADVREGYLKLEGPWGSFLAGRSLGLFSRGAVEIDYNYAHNYGLGFPCTESGDVGGRGPACGQIGFGVLFPFYAAGLVYATPSLGGFKLTGGIYDPVILAGTWERTPYPRLEGEAAFDLGFAGSGKLHLFGNGLWQRLGMKDVTTDTSAYGVGGGARLEIGPLRLGATLYTGKGIGFFYALENSQTSFNTNGTGELRKFDGYYVQAMAVLGVIDLAAGWGVARAHLFANELSNNMLSIAKQQQGINAGIFYHLNQYLVLDVDYFRADFSWYLGDKQAVNAFNAGITAVW